MPKRVGGGWLGSHERLQQKLFQEHTLQKHCVLFAAFIGQLLLSSTPHTCILRGLLVLFLFLSACYEIVRLSASYFSRHLLEDAPPPWAQEKVVHHITRRHDRKHGRYKIVPRYQMIRLIHIAAFLQCMLIPPTHSINTKIATALRHIPWDTDTTPVSTFTLEHFDVSVTLPKTYKFKTVQWDSPAAPLFNLPVLPTDGLFSVDDDPAQIMRLMDFDLRQRCHLDKDDMPLYFSLLDNTPCYSVSTTAPPLIVDTGASVCITPIKSDFETYRPSRMRIKDLSSSNTVAGEGHIRWTVTITDGKQVIINVPGFHIPTAEVRLISPQLLLHQYGGFAHQTSSKIHIHLDSLQDDIEAHYCPRTRLPMLNLHDGDPQHSFWTSTFSYSSNDAARAYPTLLSDSNVNLTAAQKEVLLWHNKLSHASISWIQLLMRDRKWLRDHINTNDSLHSGPFLPCRTKGPNCDIDGLKCIACLCAKAQRRSTTLHTRHDPDNLLRLRQRLNGTSSPTLKCSHLAPGDCISADHYLSPVNGRLYSSYGKEHKGYSCGTLFIDHASGKIFNFPQLSTTAVDTIRSKRILERLAYDEGITIKHFHSDNGVFASTAFWADCESHSQKLSFSGVGAHHQNGIAERNIKTISQWARASMLHAAFHWHEHANIKLWPQAVDYAVWVFNRLPSIDHGLSPNELWSNSRNTSHDLRRTHPFGCPVFVLDPILQDGNKLPKWDDRARRGMFVGFSPSHSSLVPLILNITTGKITPQFHVIFDDNFQTVQSLPKGTTLRDEWLNILAFGPDYFIDNGSDMDLHNEPTKTTQRHLLPRDFLEWLDQESATSSSTPPFPPPLIIENDDHIDVINDQHVTAPIHDPQHDQHNMDHVINVPEGVTTENMDHVINVPEGVTTEGATQQTLRRNPTRNTGSWKDGPANIRTCPIDGEEYDFTFVSESVDQMSVPFVARRGLRRSQPLPHKLSKSDMLDCYLLQHQ